jgi:PadR family transcriptional regulator, regulatory protein PadR
MNAVNRKILLAFWKPHILHHASAEALCGQWILTELRRHGYEISPGTRNPLLNRMERLGWLKGNALSLGGRRPRRDYRLTARGEKVLGLVRQQIRELDARLGSRTEEKRERPQGDGERGPG